MAWTDALLGGGFALAGAALQQLLAWRGDHLRSSRDQRDRARQETQEAFVDLAKSARRVQRALIDVETGNVPDRAVATLAREVDLLAEAVVVVRLIVTDGTVVRAAEQFEDHAKRLERAGCWAHDDRLRLSPLLRVLQQYAQRAPDPEEIEE